MLKVEIDKNGFCDLDLVFLLDLSFFVFDSIDSGESTSESDSERVGDNGLSVNIFMLMRYFLHIFFQRIESLAI